MIISIAQMDVITSDIKKNLEKDEAFIKEAKNRKSDIICFPEMWTTGFNWKNNASIASEQHLTIERISNLAKQYNIWISGSILALNKDNKVANTSLLFNANGECAGVYRKTHLFSFMNEDKHMAPGNHLTTVDTPWGKAGLSICYDIRFPELFRTYAIKGAQIMFSPMAFPYPRLEHWKTLVRARAIENQMFMVGTNQVGDEDFGALGKITYFGTSCIIDPWGETIAEANETDETLITANIDINQVAKIRNKMTVLKDRRPDLYELN